MADLEDNYLHSLCGGRYQQRSFIDLEVLPKHAIVYNLNNLKPTERVKNICGYEKNYLKFLEEKQLSIPLPVQSYLWPCLFRGRPAVCISPPNSGKSLSYLIPVMSGTHFCCNDDYGDLGPRVVVVCSSRKKSVQVREAALSLQHGNKDVKVLLIDQDNENTCKVRAFSECHLLITTPGPLHRLIQQKIVTFEECKLLVFDDADRSFIIHKNFIQSIIVEYCRAYKQFLDENLPEKSDSSSSLENTLRAPLLLLAETWTDQIRKFANNFMIDPLIVFGDFFEAALFCKLGIKVFVDNDRDACLGDLVDGLVHGRRGRIDRIAISCANDKEAENIQRLLKDIEVEPINIGKTLEGLDIQQAIQKCASRPRGVAIVTDEVLKEMSQIDFVSKLIHYNVPDLTSDRFKARFMLMSSQIKQRDDEMSSYFILSNSDTLVAHQLSNALKKIGKETTKDVENIKKIQNRPLCQNFLAFAYCPFKDSFCLYRHRFKDTIDAPDGTLPQEGQIKFEITNVETANKFYMRIIAYRDDSSVDGSWIKFPHVFKEIEEELQSYKRYRPALKDRPLTGRVYGIYVREKVHRVLVTSETVENTQYRSDMYFVDTGEQVRAPSIELFELSDRLRNYPYLALKAYLPGIKPLDNEMDWGTRATTALYDFIRNEKGLTSIAWIYMQRRSIFWLTGLKIMQKISAVNRSLPVWDVKDQLINVYLADINKNAFKNCTKNYNILAYKWKVLAQAKKSQFAIIDKDQPDYYYLANFVSTSEFYLQKKKNVDLLSKLEKEISDCVEKKKLIRTDHYIPGFICAAYHDYYHSYNRAKIIESDSDDLYVQVMFLDWGETKLVEKSKIYVLVDEHISRLPFQAVKCCFADYNGFAEPSQVYSLTNYHDKNDKILHHELLTKCIEKKEDTFSVQVFLRGEDKKHWINLGEKLVEMGVLLEVVPIEGGWESPLEVRLEEEVNQDLSDEEEYEEEWEREEARARKNFEEAVFRHVMEQWAETMRMMPQDNIQYNPANRVKRTGRTARLLEAHKNQPVYSRGIDSDVEDDDDSFNVDWTSGNTDDEPLIDRSNILPYDPDDDLPSNLRNNNDDEYCESDSDEFDDTSLS